jgi:hypothetical protein
LEFVRSKSVVPNSKFRIPNSKFRIPEFRVLRGGSIYWTHFTLVGGLAHLFGSGRWSIGAGDANPK